MFSNDDLKKIASFSDDTLKEKISLAANAAGVKELNLNLSSEDIAKIRKTISGLDENDMQKIMSGISPEKLNDIKKALSD